jgi:1L-myo-inositol 1-phosphate cytidylyltransferase / CDP-L-myo-inositol myo-inositolphosphotransferase
MLHREDPLLPAAPPAAGKQSVHNTHHRIPLGMTVAARDIGVFQQGAGTQRLCGLALAERNRRVVLREGSELVLDPSVAGELPWLLVLDDGVAIDRGFSLSLPAVTTAVRLEAAGATVVWGPGASVAAALAAGGGELLEIIAAPAGLLLDVRSPVARRAAERTLLRRTQKPSDGPVSRAVNRPISRPISRTFLAIGLKPIHASGICLVIGMTSAWFAAQPTGLALAMSGLLFQLASMFDGVDGEMARVTLTDSPRGAQIDSVIDNGTYLACLVGLAVGLGREGMGPLAMGLVATLLAVTTVVILTGSTLVRRHGPDSSLVHVTLWLRKASVRPDSPASLRIANRLFPITRRDAFALVLMGVSFTGVRELLVGMVAAGVSLGAYIVFFHQARLIAAAHETPTVPTTSA